ncbi:MFS transporter [Paenibacillus marinisediminis]
MVIFTSKFKFRRKFSDSRKNLWIATIEGVPSVIAMTLLGGPFLTGYLLYLGASSSQIGFVLAITTFVNISQIGFAFLLQKITYPKWAMFWLVCVHRLLWGATGLIPFLFDKEWWVSSYIVMYTIAFLASAGAGIIWTNMMGDIVPASVRGRYFGIRNTLINAIGSIVLFVGGQILDAYPGSQGFQILFIIILIFNLWDIAMFIFFPNLPLEKSTEISFRGMFMKPLRDQKFIRAVMLLACWLFVQNIILPFYSYMMLDILHVSYNLVSIIIVVQTLATMSSMYVWGNLNTKYSNTFLLLCTMPIIALSCLSWGLTLVMPTVVGLIIAHALVGIGTGGFNQMAFNFIIGDTPKSERPMFIATYSAITGFATFLGPIIGGRLFDWMKGTPLWVQTVGITGVIGIIMLILAATWGRKALLANGKRIMPHKSIEVQQ